MSVSEYAISGLRKTVAGSLCVPLGLFQWMAQSDSYISYNKRNPDTPLEIPTLASYISGWYYNLTKL